MALIYILTFSSGKQYIGMTTQTLEKRLINHRMYMRKGCDYAVYRAWRKYGDPEAKVLAVVEPHMVRETERKAIAVFDTMVPNGYNLMLGGEGAGIVSEETRAKQSKVRKGKGHTEETKKRMSIAQKARGHKSLSTWLGKKHDPASVEKRAAANRGKKRSPEFRARMSEIAKNRVFTAERRANHGAATRKLRAEKFWSSRKKRTNCGQLSFTSQW